MKDQEFCESKHTDELFQITRQNFQNYSYRIMKKIEAFDYILEEKNIAVL